MVTTTPPKPKRETWKDWLGPDAPEPDELFTRQEIVEKANEVARPPGVKPVKAGDLQLWEKIGILPHSIRRRRGDAQYALYPEWHAALARRVRQLQREGYSLDEIRPRIRAFARNLLWYDQHPVEDRYPYRNVETPEEITMWPLLVEELERLSRYWSHLQGEDVDRVEVNVLGKSGRATKYPLPIASHDDEIET